MAVEAQSGSSLKGLIAAAIVFAAILAFGWLFYAVPEPVGPDGKVQAPVAAMEEPVIARQPWTFAGMTGHFDQAQLQRGYQVFEAVCSKCHSADLFAFRNLGEPGGPAFSEGQVKTLAATAEVDDAPDQDGVVKKRPGRPSDTWQSPYANENAARAANGGALPPDFSVLAKARGLHAEYPWYMAPVVMGKDILSGYQEGGPDYIYAVLNGYLEKPPVDMMGPDGKPMVMATGMNFNAAFPGHQIAMPQPLKDGDVPYGDGSPQTLDQYSRDVASFMMWMAEPTLEERKSLGIRVLIYLGILSVLLFLAKQIVWSRIKH